MAGPNQGMGARMLVHMPGEFPMVAQLGEALPVGYRAFVGMEITEVKKLSSFFCFRLVSVLFNYSYMDSDSRYTNSLYGLCVIDTSNDL